MSNRKAGNHKIDFSSQEGENENENSVENREIKFYEPQEDFDTDFPFDKWTLSSGYWRYDELTKEPLYLNTTTRSSNFKGYDCPIPDPSVSEFYTESSRKLIWFRNPSDRRFRTVANSGLQDKPKKRKNENSKSQGDELNKKSGNKADSVAGKKKNKSSLEEEYEEAVDYEDFSESEYNKSKGDAPNKTAAHKVDATGGKFGREKGDAPVNKEVSDGRGASDGANLTSTVKEKHPLDNASDILS